MPFKREYNKQLMILFCEKKIQVCSNYVKLGFLHMIILLQVVAKQVSTGSRMSALYQCAIETRCIDLFLHTCYLAITDKTTCITSKLMICIMSMKSIFLSRAKTVSSKKDSKNAWINTGDEKSSLNRVSNSGLRRSIQML